MPFYLTRLLRTFSGHSCYLADRHASPAMVRQDRMMTSSSASVHQVSIISASRGPYAVTTRLEQTITARATWVDL